MKNFVFEVHTYAPELNRVYYRGEELRNLRSVASKLTKDYKENLRFIRSLNQVKPFRKGVRIYVQYEEMQMNRRYAGLFSSYKELKRQLTELRKRHSMAKDIKINFYYL